MGPNCIHTILIYTRAFHDGTPKMPPNENKPCTKALSYSAKAPDATLPGALQTMQI